MKLAEVVDTHAQVASRSGRKDKVALLAALLRRARPDEVPVAAAWLTGEPTQGRLGVGGATLEAAFPVPPAEAPTLGVLETDRALGALGEVSGPGANAERLRRLQALLHRATPGEQAFLARLLGGGLRQGALEGVLVEAVAQAAGVPAASVRRALMLHGALGEVARAALEAGAAGLSRFGLQLFRPVGPMLARTAEDVDDALARLGAVQVEDKIDGARVQVHKGGEVVRVYTRRLNEVTDAVPEIVEAVRALPVDDLVLDGEAVVLRPDGTPAPFQVTMRRFGRRLDVDRLRRDLPLTPRFFDLLHAGGRTLLDAPTRARIEILRDLVPEAGRVQGAATEDPAAAAARLEAALRAGHEGVMVKALDAPYEAGRRGGAWLKVKPAHTLDLVVLAAEWGHGRRRGLLSNLHLGARDPSTGGFVMLGKTFKGLTDAMLEWQTRRFLDLELGRDATTVYVRPEQVVEVAFDGVQDSPQYPGGVALRFARVVRYRRDKSAAEADPIDAVRALRPRATGVDVRPHDR